MSDTRHLEEKVAYLEKNIADLDAVVRDLSAQMQIVLAQMKRFVRIERTLDAQDEAPADEKPPHY